jgi:hypothetical protein
MESVEESLLQSRHSVGSETEKETERDAECIRLEPPTKPPFSQKKEPTQEEKELAQERDRKKKIQSEQ